MLLGLLGAFFIAKKFITQEVEDYANGLGFKVKGFRPSWKLSDPLAVKLEIDIDIRNDNNIGGQVLGFDGWITWGEDGAKLGDLDVDPFDLQANGHINKTTWEVRVPLLTVGADVQAQIAEGNWQQLPWLDGELLTSYGGVGIKQGMIKLS